MKQLKNVFPFLALLVLGGHVLAQNEPPPPKPVPVDSWAKIEDGLFRSRALGLSLEIPKEFTTLSLAEAKMISDAGADLLKRENPSKNRIDEAVGNSRQLLVVMEKPYGTQKNSGLELVTARQQKGVTATISLAANVSALKGTPFVLKSTQPRLKIGNFRFAAADLEGKFGDVIVKQRMLVRMHRDYAIVFVLTYHAPEQLLKLQELVASLTLS